MSNEEKKREIWANIYPKYKHLEPYCTIKVEGLDDNSIYFNPSFIMEETAMIRAQGDVNTPARIYGFCLILDGRNSVIGDLIVEPAILGWVSNREVVKQAFETLNRVNEHIYSLQGLASEYIINIIIGESFAETSNSITNELNTLNRLVDFIKNKK